MDIIFNWFKDKLIESAGKILTDASSVSIGLFDKDIVKNSLNLFEYMGYILLAVGILFAIANTCIQCIEDDRIQVHNLIINILKSIIAITFLKTGAIELFTFSITVQKAVAKIINETPKDYSSTITSIDKILDGGKISILWSLAIFIVVLISSLIVLFQAIKRAGIYYVQITVGFLYVFGLPSGNTEGFLSWCRQTVAIAVTNVIQITLLTLGFALMTEKIENVFLGIGVILAATSVEKVANQYGFAVNSRQSMGGAVRTIQTSYSTYKFASKLLKS